MNDISNHPLLDLIDAARRAGADEAEVVMSRSESLSVAVRQGRLENVERDEPAYCGLRVWVGERSAGLSSADLADLGKQGPLLERVLAIARAAPKNPFGGLAQLPAAAHDEEALELFDPTSLDTLQLVDLAREAEAAALAIPGVSNSGGGMASFSTSERFHATSRGFAGHRRRRSFGLGMSVVAGTGVAKQTDGYGSTACWRTDLVDASEVGAEAGRRAAARLAPRRLISMRAPVIFERRIALDVLGPFIGAIGGPSVVRGTSFLRQCLGQQVFAPGIDVSDDPAVRRGLGSRAVDDEGVVCTPRALVENGVLTGWLLNVASAGKLGLQPNGYAGRGGVGASGVGLSNLRVAPGRDDLATLMAQAGSGLMVTGMFSPSLNPNTGEWSAGVHGMWFDAGEPAFAVSEVTVAGSLPDFYARLIPGSDVAQMGAAMTPSLMVDAVSIGGL